MASLRTCRSAVLVARRTLTSVAGARCPLLPEPLLSSATTCVPPAPGSACDPVPFTRAHASAPNPAYFEIYNRQRQLQPLNHLVPDVAADAWVAPNAVLVGGVTVEDQASVWYGAVLRADLNFISVGMGSNIQDRVVVHSVAPSPSDGLPTETRIGRNVTVGQGSVLTSCEVEDEAIIGQRCIVLKGALVEKHAVLADGTVVGEGQLVPGGELWAGNPAKFVRTLTADEKAALPKVAESIKHTAGDHAAEFLPDCSAYIQAEKVYESLTKAYDARKAKST